MSYDFEQDRILELLADQATVGLTDHEKEELPRLMRTHQTEDDFSLDLVVDLLAQSEGLSLENISAEPDMRSLPEHLRSRVIDDADRFIGLAKSTSANSMSSESGIGSRPILKNQGASLQKSKVQSTFRVREGLAWLVAAASILFAAFIYLGALDPTVPKTVEVIPALIGQSKQSDLEGFINESSAADLFETKLTAGNHESGKSAEATVYWNRKTKRGFLKLNGLTRNDPANAQYQLWVIDRKRGIEDRPNAGVFDVTESGNSVFAFRSDLEVFDAQGFAITVEKPGGVNKSDLSKIALLNLGT